MNMERGSIFKTALSVFFTHIGATIMALIFCLGLSMLLIGTWGQIVSGVIVLLVYSIPLYSILWNTGNSDLNKQNFNRIEKDSFKGFKIGLLASVPVYVMTILFVLSKFGLFYNFVIPFKLANAYVWPFMNIIRNTMYLPDYTVLEVIATALLTFIPAVLCGIFYIMGNKDFAPMQKIIYKKKKDSQK